MGMRVGNYIVTSTLGQGTFGKVMLAQHQKTGVEYAIKILDKGAIKEKELALNVRREIAIMKALDHPNIVNLREVLTSSSKLYIVIDLVRGGELFEQIERHGKLEPSVARAYFQQLIDGVDYCHKRDVYHRDLKPENLLIDSDGTLKITDFGVSSMKGGAGQTGNDLLYTACGTPYYCAPEIINGAESGYSGVKIDAWSCGIILYLLLTGSLPFQTEEMMQLYQLINRCEVEYPAWLDDDAKHLISCLLTKDPTARYSLEDVKRHPWFLVDYAHAADENNSSAGNVRMSPAPKRASSGEPPAVAGNQQPVVSTPAPPSPPPAPQAALSPAPPQSPPALQSPPAPRSPPVLQSPPAPTPAPAPARSPKRRQQPEQRDYSKYVGQELSVLIRDVLPGKPAKRIEKVVDCLETCDVDCIEDLLFLVSTLRTAENVTKWLEDKSGLPALTSMRVARFFQY